MTISSTAPPDIAALCRSLVGRDAIAIDRIGAGRNSRVFRIRLDGALPGADREVVLKLYRRDAADARDRLATEVGALEFLWQNGVRAIPRPIAADRDRHCAVYEYVAGEVLLDRPVGAPDIDAAVRFLGTLLELRARPDAAALCAASEANFSIAAIAAHVSDRFARLRSGGETPERRPAVAWLDAVFAPLLREVVDWGGRMAATARIDVDEELPAEGRTLSPSDFGFHNAIRRPDGSLAFVDFEYFGWDDPAKTIADFLLHPGMSLDEPLKRRFATRAFEAFAGVRMLPDRVRIVYPLFGLKWCLILLNEFLPSRLASSADDPDAAGRADAVRSAQMQKAERLAARIAGEYRERPVWATT